MTHRAGIPTEPVHFANLADWLAENWGLDSDLSEVVQDLRLRSGQRGEDPAAGTPQQIDLMRVPRAIRREPVGTGRRETGVYLPTKDGVGFWVNAEREASLVTYFPRLDIPGELRKIQAWLGANPRRRKSSRGMARFVNAWMMRAAEKVGQGRAGGEAPLAPKVAGMNADGSLRYAR